MSLDRVLSLPRSLDARYSSHELSSESLNDGRTQRAYGAMVIEREVNVE
jgi:hypothetical protein